MRNFKVAIYGTAASYHDVAAQKFYGQEVDIVECGSFRQCCEKLRSNDADYAVMAIENSLAGSILSNYDLIRTFGLRIIGEQYLKIELHLVAKKGSFKKDLVKIYSHPMALAQCTDFIRMNPSLKFIEAGDTANCVKNILEKDNSDSAAIAGEAAALKYGAEIIERNIGNIPVNHTRFVILAKNNMSHSDPDKASVCFRLPHEVGSLADVLAALKRNGVNVSKIQSVPVPGEPEQYTFHTDLEWIDHNNYLKAIKNIKRNTTELTILGEYRKMKLEQS